MLSAHLATAAYPLKLSALHRPARTLASWQPRAVTLADHCHKCACPYVRPVSRLAPRTY
jgi:hypothetical protein